MEHLDTNMTSVACQRRINIDEFTHASLGLAVCIIVVLTFVEKRQHPRRCKCCGGRPGLPVPMNLLDGGKNGMSYAAAFGSTATNCLTLFAGNYIPWGTPNWATVFYAMLAVIEMGINYYPFFACLTTKSRFIGSTIGLFYSVIWFLVNLAQVVECYNATYWTIPGEPIIIQLPVLLCLFFLVCKFFAMFISCLTTNITNIYSTLTGSEHRCSPSHSDYLTFDGIADDEIAKPHQIMHVKELFRGKSSRIPPCLKLGVGEVWHTWNYPSDPTFKYSPRLKVTFFVAILCVYEFGLLFFLGVVKGVNWLERFLTQHQSSLINVAELYRSLKIFVSTLKVCCYAAFGVSSIITLMYVVQMFFHYRAQITRLHRGDCSFLPKRKYIPPSAQIMSEALTYSGTQIAYILWGYYTMILSVFVLSLAFSYFVLLPSMGMVSSWWLQPVWTILPTVVVSWVMHHTQIYLCKKFILQKEFVFNRETGKLQRILALHNRKAFHNLSYFMFFFNIFIGLYKCLKRIFKGILLGVMFLSRIDRSVLTRGFEHWDTGYMAYVCFLKFESTHCHPVLVVFCQLLVDEIRNRNSCRADDHFALQMDSPFGPTCSTVDLAPFNTSYHNIGAREDGLNLNNRKGNIRARNKWYKAYTMIKNPSLVIVYDKDDWLNLEMPVSIIQQNTEYLSRHSALKKTTVE